MASAALVILALFTSFFVTLPSAQVVTTLPGFQATYPAGKIGGSSETGLPVQFLSIPPANEYFLDYEVSFDPGWAWVQGGKLPGLVGGLHTSGCAPITPGGWSARFMWRTGGQGEVYLYDQNRKNSCGDDYSFPNPGTFSIGKWIRISEHVVINSPGQNNGLIEAWMDGVKKISLNNIQLRGKVPVDSALIDAVSLETFYGGDTHSWAPNQTTHSHFNGFVVRKDLPDFSKPFEPITTTDLKKPIMDLGRDAGIRQGYLFASQGAQITPSLPQGIEGQLLIYDLRGSSLGVLKWNRNLGQWDGWKSIKLPAQPSTLVAKNVND